MASRDRDAVEHNPSGHNARNPSSSWTSSPPGRASTSHTLSSETASLHSVRKRASFFGRSNSGASSMRRSPATSDSAKPSFSAARTEDDAARPMTSASSDMRRRKTDPLQSIRDSIFGAKKKASRDAADASNSRPASRGNEHPPQDVPVHHGSFNSEEDYYRHLRKHSISPPFNFQHVTHTARNQLPQLETVDEKDLPGQFWSVAAYQRPRRRVHGFKVDDLETKHRQMGLIQESPEPSPAFSPPMSPTQAVSPPPPRLTIPELPGDGHLRLISPISPVSPMEDHIPETLQQQSEQIQPSREVTPISVSDSSTATETHNVRHPRRQSSLGALDKFLEPHVQQHPGARRGVDLRSQQSFYDSNSSSDGDSRKGSPNRAARTLNTSGTELNASMPPNFTRDYDVAFRSRQPLPSLPPQPAAVKNQSISKLRGTPNALQVNQASPASMLSPTLPPTKATSLKSKCSSRSSRSARRSPAASQSSADLRKSSLYSVSDVSWEDSVDLAYEEEAESTCDFTWNARQRARRSVSLKNDSKRDSAATISNTDSPNLSNPSESAISLHRNSSTDTIADRKPGDHQRGTSVGHRGFLAARKNSSTPDLLSKAKEPPAPLSFSQSSTQISVLSPVFSVAEEDAQKTPFTPAELHYPRIERVSNDYLSDPESYRNSNSSKHRKSSSYGSYGSWDSAGTRAGPPASNPNPNTTRWSVASSGSMPELMHSRPKSKSSLSRSVTSQPLETLPQSPPGSGNEAEFKDIPRSQPETGRNTFVRRSGESSDRVVLAAGRAVQRGRPSSSARYSQHLEPQPPPRRGVRESWVAGPDWI